MKKQDVALIAGFCFMSAVIGGAIVRGLPEPGTYAKVGVKEQGAGVIGQKNEGEKGKEWVEGTEGWEQSGRYIFPASYTTDSVGIGTNSPTARLHIAGNVKIVDGTQGANKVLTTVDGSGLASWATPGGGTVTSIGPGTPGTQTGTSQLTFSSNPITGAGTIALSNTGVTAGYYTNTNLTVDTQGRLTNASSGTAGIPTGVIVMWSGTLATIPGGWALCDGTSPTLDLRDKFIYGWTAGVDPGGTGGLPSHSHTVNSHTHTVDSHTHTISHTHVVDPAQYNQGAFDLGQYAYSTSAASGNCYSTWAHTHNINIPATTSSDASTGTSGTASPGTSAVSPGTTTESNLPPYYKLAYIMKL